MTKRRIGFRCGASERRGAQHGHTVP